MSNVHVRPQPERRGIVQYLANNPLERRLRAVRAYVIPLRGPVGFRRIPVARYTASDDTGIDVPILNEAWTVQGVIDELAVPVVHPAFGGFAPRWDVYDVWYSRPLNQRPTANTFMRHLNAPSVTGEFVIFRQTVNGDRLLDVRRLDYASVEVALLRVVNELVRSDPRWLVGR